MADNIKDIAVYVNQKITNAGGPGSVLAKDHNKILNDALTKVGKYTGSPYKAMLNGTSVPTGCLVFNGNSLDNTSDFILTISKKTADFNNVMIIVESLESGDLIHFKDFVGRSFYFIIQSFLESNDDNGLDTVDFTVKASADNPTYTYQPLEEEICILEFIIKRTSSTVSLAETITIDGVDYLYKKTGTTGTATSPEKYDIAEGGIRVLTEDGETFNVSTSLIYNTGAPGTFSSWEILTEKELTF